MGLERGSYKNSATDYCTIPEQSIVAFLYCFEKNLSAAVAVLPTSFEMRATSYQSAFAAVPAFYIVKSQASSHHAHSSFASQYSSFDSMVEEARDCFQDPRAPSAEASIPKCWSENVRLLLAIMEHDLRTVPASATQSCGGGNDGGCG